MNRRSIFKWVTALGVGLASAIPLAARADEDVLAAVKKAGVLKVGTETAFAPFDFIDAGKHVGLNVDLFAEIGKELGVKIEWIELPWDGVLPGLESGKFDIVAGPATITKARLERYDFSPPVAEATVALLKKAGDTSLKAPADIAGKAVGSGKATAQLAQLQAYSRTLPSPVTAKEYVSFNEAYADLVAGRIVAVANSLPNIAYYAQQKPGIFEIVLPPFGARSYFGFPEKKDDAHKSLNAAVAGALNKIKADGRMATFQKKWFGVSFDVPDVAPEPNF